MDLRAGDSLAVPQLIKTQFDLPIQPLAESLLILPEFKPFEERFRLVFIQAFDLFDRKFNTAHADGLSNVGSISTQPPALAISSPVATLTILNCSACKAGSARNESLPK